MDPAVHVVIHRTNLNPRQERFVIEYLKDWNGTQAAIRAGYAVSSAAVHAHRLLKNERVLEKIRVHQNRVQHSNDVLLKKTLRGLAAIAFSDPGTLFDHKWDLVLPLEKLPKDTRQALDRLEVVEFVKDGRKLRKVKVKFADKLAALEILGNHLGMFPKPPKAGR